jgi:hypothetical protein
VAILAGAIGCRSLDVSRSDKAVLPDITPTAIEYVDSDAFDRLFEAALVNQDPVIAVNTGRETADWGARLNAWIAAWNRGGRSRSRTARGQAPKVVIDGDSIREFRLLVEGLLGRIDELAETGSTWYRDSRERSRRVALLKPYNLRFHKAEDSTIQLIFFHEQYSAYYPRFVQKLMQSDTMPEGAWSRTVECSECQAARRTGRLTGRGGSE